MKFNTLNTIHTLLVKNLEVIDNKLKVVNETTCNLENDGKDTKKYELIASETIKERCLAISALEDFESQDWTITK